MRKVSFELGESDIERAIRQVQAYKEHVRQNIAKIISDLVSIGVEIAKAEIVSLGAAYTGELASSIQGMVFTDGTRGLIFTDCPYAAYVEFGTGVVGQSSPHPEPPQGWRYDVNSHGEEGWWYYDETEERYRWTAGMVSRPFLYLTSRQLEQEAISIARRVFRDS